MAISAKELEALRREARRLAEAAGLDPYPVTFGVVDYDTLNELAAYEGFPERYPHWRFGMSYDYQRKRAAYSGVWTYEMVINADPTIAYLRESNTPVQHKAVMVHVYAHADFFKNNQWFRHAPKEMPKLMRAHAERIETYMNRYGASRVEAFIDQVLSVQYNIDQHAPFVKRTWQQSRRRRARPGPDSDGDGEERQVGKLPVKRPYMETFINPPRWVERRRKRLEEQKRRERTLRLEELELRRPHKDLLGYLMRHGRLEDWQIDVMAMLREEAFYFVPQIQTRVMNEGWAAYWQSELMKQFADPNEFVDHAEMQSLVLGGGKGKGKALNPYSLGKLIWEDIKERWDKGRFGRDWERCTDAEALKNWDTKAKLGAEKLFEVRRHYNDVTFLSEFFTEELFKRLELFTYEYIPETGAYHLTSRDYNEVKKKLLFQFTNLGRPTIKVATGNYDNKGELLLLHEWNGVSLDLEEAKAVLKNIYTCWGRPVNLKTIVLRKVRDANPLRDRIHPDRPQTAIVEEQGVMLRYDGERFRELALAPEEVRDLKVDEVDYRTIPDEWVG